MARLQVRNVQAKLPSQSFPSMKIREQTIERYANTSNRGEYQRNQRLIVAKNRRSVNSDR